ncbi:hypothetical protein KIPB_012624, partial [Kipferlia bialata]
TYLVVGETQTSNVGSVHIYKHSGSNGDFEWKQTIVAGDSSTWRNWPETVGISPDCETIAASMAESSSTTIGGNIMVYEETGSGTSTFSLSKTFNDDDVSGCTYH